MPKASKLRLDELKVESFITGSEKIVGGTRDLTTQCPTYTQAETCDPNCTVNTWETGGP